MLHVLALFLHVFHFYFFHMSGITGVHRRREKRLEINELDENGYILYKQHVSVSQNRCNIIGHLKKKFIAIFI